jgi:hypothetical protein
MSRVWSAKFGRIHSRYLLGLSTAPWLPLIGANKSIWTAGRMGALIYAFPVSISCAAGKII